MLSAAVIGCAGYAGQETLDRVLAHPELDPIALGSDSRIGLEVRRHQERIAAVRQRLDQRAVAVRIVGREDAARDHVQRPLHGGLAAITSRGL